MANPIVHRELVTVLRTRRMLLFQCGLICVFALLVIVRWPSEARMAQSGARAHEVFRLFIYGLLTTILLLLPRVPRDEHRPRKNEGTLALLLNTPLGAWRIYFGKAAGRLGPCRHRAVPEPAGGGGLLRVGGPLAHRRLAGRVRIARPGGLAICRAGALRQQLFEFD